MHRMPHSFMTSAVTVPWWIDVCFLRYGVRAHRCNKEENLWIINTESDVLCAAVKQQHQRNAYIGSFLHPVYLSYTNFHFMKCVVLIWPPVLLPPEEGSSQLTSAGIRPSAGFNFLIIIVESNSALVPLLYKCILTFICALATKIIPLMVQEYRCTCYF